MNCGTNDQLQKGQALTLGNTCAGCRGKFPPHKLREHGSVYYCKKCLKKRGREEGGFLGGLLASIKPGGGSDDQDARQGSKKRLLMMLGAVAVLAAVSYYMNS